MPFCNLEVSATPLLSPPRLLIGIATPTEEEESVSGTAAVMKGSVARMNAVEKYISVKALRVGY